MKRVLVVVAINNRARTRRHKFELSIDEHHEKKIPHTHACKIKQKENMMCIVVLLQFI